VSRIYDWKWEQMARRWLRAHPICAVARCGKPARHVDHIVNVKAALYRRLDPTNLQSLCHGCHNRLTKAYDAGSIRGACDAEGMPLDPGHPWAQSGNAEAIAVANAKARADPMVASRLKRNAVR
jgi:HNH endonuclease